MAFTVVDGDTLYLAYLREVYVYPPLRFKNKKQEKFYWKTVRDVKKTLPYAKMIMKEIETTDALLATMNARQQRKYWKTYEKQLFRKYEDDFKDMTMSQGQMLIKLVDRECDKTSYDVIKMYKGNFIAAFWQGVAKIYGTDLKEGYDADKDEKDRIVERVITLVEAGQL
ncbi:MAG: DUF4294 domain-containing protein [Paludibacteraceae bacterium]|nr:DUF4294 domain-containing protein [Paludibacteraceae bacterium]